MQTAQAAPPPPPTPEPRRSAGWIPLITLLAVIALVTFGGFLFSGTSTDTAFAGDVEVGTAVEVAQGVTIQPAAGWQVAGPSGDPAGVVLEGGSGRLLVGVPGGTGGAEELLNFYVANYLEPQASQLSVGSSEAITLTAGPAVVADYVGVFEGVAVPIEGEIVAVIAPSGTAVVMDGWASQGSYGAIQEQIVAMANSVEIP